MFPAQLIGFSQESLRRDNHAGFSLDRFHQDRGGVRGDRLSEGVDVPVGDDFEAGGQRAESPPVLFVGREGDGGDGPAVEVVLKDDDLRLIPGDSLHVVSPAADRLDGRFHRLRPGVHRQDHLFSRQFRHLLVKFPQLIVVEGAGGEGDPVRLLLEGGDDPGVTMAVVEGRIGAQHVHVPIAVGIFHPDTLSLGKDDRKGMVVVCSVAFCQFDNRFARGHGVLLLWACSPNHLSTL